MKSVHLLLLSPTPALKPSVQRNPRCRVVAIVVRDYCSLPNPNLTTELASQTYHLGCANSQATAKHIPLENVTVVPRDGIGKDEFIVKFPRSRGKIPGLECPDGTVLTETLAIVTV